MITIHGKTLIRSIFFVLPFIISSTGSLGIDLYKQTSFWDDTLRKGNGNIRANPWNNDSFVLYKFMNAEYYGLIKVGSPAKEFKVIFDTTWGDSWLPSQHCGLLEVACMMHTRYDSTRSSSYQANGALFELNSKFMSLKGFASIDTFHVSSEEMDTYSYIYYPYLPHLFIANQTFIEMTHLSVIPFVTQKADGIIGLGFSSSSKIGALPLFYNMVKQYQIMKRVFTIYMNRDETTEKAGTLILGATDRKHVKDELTIVPVVEKNLWTVKVDRIVVDVKKKSYPFCSTGCKAQMDSSANTIAGPADEIEKINNLINARKITTGWPYRYVVDCRQYAKLPNIDIVLNGTPFTIVSKYYIQPLTYRGVEVCLSPFMPGYGSTWELGGAFLMQFYTEYDFDSGTIAIGVTKF